MSSLLRNPLDGEKVITDAPDDYPGWELLATTERAPDDFEIVDEATGAIVLDRNARADARAGRDHNDAIRLVKLFEATMVVNGHDLSLGFLADDAATRGVTIQQRAQQIFDRAQPMRTREIARITEKIGT